jgi:HPt (histidine-containing phosphotransfer) domain-containing protein
MDGYVSKPVRQPELLDAMALLIPHLFLDRAAAESFLSAQATKNSAGSPTSAVFSPTPARSEPERKPMPESETKKRNAAPEMNAPILPRAPRDTPPARSVPAPPAVPIQPPAQQRQPAPQSLPFDPEALMENLGGDKAMLGEVILLCRENDAPRLLSDLAQGIRDGDADGVAKSAHALKGMVGAFNATEAYSAAKLLEMIAKAGNMEALKDEADDFVRKLRALLISLENFAGTDHRDLTWI